MDFKEQVARCLKLQPELNTVIARSALAKQMCDMAKNEVKLCEQLVYEQHLQQQGWATVIANMDDLTKEFIKRFESFYSAFNEHMDKRNEYLLYLNCFDADLHTLSKIPISPNLLVDTVPVFSGFDEFLDDKDSYSASLSAIECGDDAATGTSENSLVAPKITTTDDELNVPLAAIEHFTDGQNVGDGSANSSQIDTSGTESGKKKSKPVSLLNWLTAREANTKFIEVAENCTRSIHQFDVQTIQNLREAVETSVKNARQENMKEIKGLSPRLTGLDRLIKQASDKVQEQHDLANAFHQNQLRARSIADPSIFPDLCESHSRQLNVMLKNQNELRDIHRRIFKAKEELSNNLEQRLKYIVHLENRMSELDTRLLFYSRCLRRVHRHLLVIEQIHTAPKMYVQAMAEVVRRRTFSEYFAKVSNNMKRKN